MVSCLLPPHQSSAVPAPMTRTTISTCLLRLSFGLPRALDGWGEERLSIIWAWPWSSWDCAAWRGLQHSCICPDSHFAPALFPGCRGIHAPLHPNSHMLPLSCLSDLHQKLHILSNKACGVRSCALEAAWLGCKSWPHLDCCASYLPSLKTSFVIQNVANIHSWGFVRR